MNVTGGRLLDDIKDHWRAIEHHKERRYFLNMLFDWAHNAKSRVREDMRKEGKRTEIRTSKEEVIWRAIEHHKEDFLNMST